VNYNSEGYYDKSSTMILDLRQGAEVVIVVKGAMNEGVVGYVHGKRDENYSIFLQEHDGSVFRLFGRWWIESALRGAVHQLPLVNRMPKVKIQELTLDDSSLKVPDSFDIIQSHQWVVDEEFGENTHLWSLSLSKSAKNIVSEVIWMLHPTFRDPNVKCTKYPFVIKRRGWGVFKIKIQITLIPGILENPIINTSHKLDFSVDGDAAFVTKVSLK